MAEHRVWWDEVAAGRFAGVCTCGNRTSGTMADPVGAVVIGRGHIPESEGVTVGVGSYTHGRCE